MFEDKTMEIFSSRDMIRQQLITYAETYLEINNIDLTKSSYLSYLINTMSVLTANLIYYNTATYREFFLVRAHQKESVLNLAAMIGYKPDTATPATAQILVKMPADFRSSAQVIMHGRHDSSYEAFKFYAGDIVFSCENEIRLDIIMDRGRLLAANIVEVNKLTGGTRGVNWKLVEGGKFLTFLVNATQVEDQKTTFNFPRLRPYQYFTQGIPCKGDFAGIDIETINPDVITDTAIVWSDAPSLFLVNSGDYGYTYRVNEDAVKVFFGNGVIGTQPTEGHLCTVTVQVTKGFDGNVIAGSITKADRLSTTIEINGNLVELPVNLTCLNTSPALGGKSYPSIDEIRSQAIVQVSTNKRLVAQYDFENAGDVVRDLPIQHSIPVLKRSDLKRNEICLFTDIIFADSYVPTRNSVIKIPLGRESFPIRFRDEIVPDLNRFEQSSDYEGISFVSMFDLQLDPLQKTCSYFYTLKNIDREAVLKQTWTPDTVILPHTSSFEVVKDSTDSANDLLTIKFQYEKTTDKAIYSTLKCYLEIDESGITLPMTPMDGTSGSYFYIEKPLTEIDEGNLLFNFQVKYVDSLGTDQWVCNCHSETVIKQSLKEFMYSKVKKFTSKDADYGTYWGIVYDVPVILLEYLQKLDEDMQSDNFTDQVLHRIVTFDMSEYRMITDFVNLKFSNTFGPITNMNHNPDTKGVVNRIDPESIPSCSHDGYACVVTNDTNAWSGAPWYKKTGGFIAKYNSWVSNYWVFSQLKTNDIVVYDPDDRVWRREVTKDALQKFIYNGDNLYSMTKTIPLEIDLEVWKDPSANISDSGLINTIKDSITRAFLLKMGYDKPVYVSDLTGIVQNVTGVSYCKVLKPEHDIFFNYDHEMFNHEDLLRYSPQLVYMAANSINVTLRKRTDLRG